MAQTSNENRPFVVTPEEAAHYNRLREARDWSWETLADHFDKITSDPASPALAAWAREQAAAVETPAPTRGRGRGRTETR